MVSISAVSALQTAKPQPAAPSSSSSGGFADALAASSDQQATSPVRAVPDAQGAESVDGRQKIAVDGKDLPDKDDGDQKDDDARDQNDASGTVADPTIIDLSWVSPQALPPAPPPPPVTTVSGGGFSVAFTSGTALPLPVGAEPSAIAQAGTDADGADASKLAPGKAIADLATQGKVGDTPASAPAAASSQKPADSSDPIDALAAALRDRLSSGSTSAAPPSASAANQATPAANPATASTAANPAAAAGIVAPAIVAQAAAAPTATNTAPPGSEGDESSTTAAATSAVAAQATTNGAAQGIAARRGDARAQRVGGVATPASAQADAPARSAIGVVQPAARAFADSIAAAQVPSRRLLRDLADSDQNGGIGSLTGLSTSGSDAIRAPVSSPVIDTGNSKWLEQTIDHIEALRDAANAQDTRIRLVPDALGKVAIALTRDGDTLHVRFSAEQPETRQLLTDAQPKLAEIAAQRGIRIGQSTVDSGQGGGQQRQPETARQPIANRLAVNTTPEPTDDSADQDGWIA